MALTYISMPDCQRPVFLFEGKQVHMRLVVRHTLFAHFFERLKSHLALDQLHTAGANHVNIRNLLCQGVCDFAVLRAVDSINIHLVGIVAQLFV